MSRRYRRASPAALWGFPSFLRGLLLWGVAHPLFDISENRHRSGLWFLSLDDHCCLQKAFVFLCATGLVLQMKGENWLLSLFKQSRSQCLHGQIRLCLCVTVAVPHGDMKTEWRMTIFPPSALGSRVLSPVCSTDPDCEWKIDPSRTEASASRMTQICCHPRHGRRVAVASEVAIVERCRLRSRR